MSILNYLCFDSALRINEFYVLLLALRFNEYLTPQFEIFPALKINELLPALRINQYFKLFPVLRINEFYS